MKPDSPPVRSTPQAIYQIQRPAPQLLRYYFLVSLLAGPFFPFALLPLLFKYITLKYRFDKEGISMRWGILFRREVVLNYSRIQDIHLRSNLIERWMTLAKIQIQTASGSATPEMTIEGLHEFEAIRDFLYEKMRGAKEPKAKPGAPLGHGSPIEVGELVAVLKSVAEELRAIRLAVEASKKNRGEP